MARPEVTGRKMRAAGQKPSKKTSTPDVEDDDADDDAYTINEFCRRNKISIQAFYKHRADMPRGYLVGTRRLISREEARDWRRARTEAAKSQPLKTDLFHKTRRDLAERKQQAAT